MWGAVHGLSQVVGALVGLRMARDAIGEGLLGGIAEEDEPVVSGQAHDGVLHGVARGAPAVLGVQVRDVEGARVGRHRLHGEPVAVGVALGLVGLGVRGVLLAVLIEIGQRCHAINEAALGGVPARRGQLIAVAIGRLHCRRFRRLVATLGRGRRCGGGAPPHRAAERQRTGQRQRTQASLAREAPLLPCLLSHVSSFDIGNSGP